MWPTRPTKLLKRPAGPNSNPDIFHFFQKKRRLNITFKGIFRTVDIFLLRVCLERWIFGYSQKFPLDILMNEDIHGNYRSDKV
jgi:hypothetical protein